jgi:hypothetical protein
MIDWRGGERESHRFNGVEERGSHVGSMIDWRGGEKGVTKVQ